MFNMIYSKCFPAWGPYGKKYMGISRIADHDFAKGVRFDVTVAPAIFGGDIKVPNTTLPSGCHPLSGKTEFMQRFPTFVFPTKARS